MGVVGSGPAAAVHLETIRATPNIDAVDIPTMTTPPVDFRELDAVVVAVTPAQVGEVLESLPDGLAALVESPVADVDRPADLPDRPATMTGAPLLHAPVVRRGLRAVARLAGDGGVHHLVVRARTPDGPVDALHQLLPVLLAAAARPVEGVRGSARGGDPEDPVTFESLDVQLDLDDGREVRVEWESADDGRPAEADLEAASAGGVVALTLWPRPALEIDGTPVASSRDDHPLVALGFVEQLARLIAVTRGEAAWPALSVGVGVSHAISSALRSARSGAGDDNARGEFCPGL